MNDDAPIIAMDILAFISLDAQHLLSAKLNLSHRSSLLTSDATFVLTRVTSSDQYIINFL